MHCTKVGGRGAGVTLTDETRRGFGNSGIKLAGNDPHAGRSCVENKVAGGTLGFMFKNFCPMVYLKNNKVRAHPKKKKMDSHFSFW